MPSVTYTYIASPIPCQWPDLHKLDVTQQAGIYPKCSLGFATYRVTSPIYWCIRSTTLTACSLIYTCVLALHVLSVTGVLTSEMLLGIGWYNLILLPYTIVHFCCKVL